MLLLLLLLQLRDLIFFTRTPTLVLNVLMTVSADPHLIRVVSLYST